MLRLQRGEDGGELEVEAGDAGAQRGQIARDCAVLEGEGQIVKPAGAKQGGAALDRVRDLPQGSTVAALHGDGGIVHPPPILFDEVADELLEERRVECVAALAHCHQIARINRSRM